MLASGPKMATVVQNWPQCSDIDHSSLKLATVVQNWLQRYKIGHIGPKSAIVVQNWPQWSRIGHSGPLATVVPKQKSSQIIRCLRYMQKGELHNISLGSLKF